RRGGHRDPRKVPRASPQPVEQLRCCTDERQEHRMRLIAGLLLLASLVPQEAAKEKPCDMSKVEDGWYCVRCKKILMKTEKKSDLDKDGNCLACSSAPEK